MRPAGLAAVILLLAVSVTHAQRGRRSVGGGTPTARAAGIEGVVVTFQGALKKLSKKEVLIESDEKQLMTVRCSGKTKYFDKDSKEVKPADIDLDTLVLVEAREDVDSKLTAIDVKIVATPGKSLEK